MVPFTFIENNRVAIVPTVDMKFPLMLGRTTGSTRLGPGAEGFDATDVLPVLMKKSIEYIGSRADDAKRGKPFFLYIPFASPHTPILPTKEWQGKSGLNPYADFVMQTDWSIGQILAELDTRGLADNTLVIVTSDNGCSPQAKYDELLPKGHNPSFIYRGTKADIFDGGHRIPFLVRWPGKVKPGGRSDQTLCLTDFMATVAAILETKLPDNAGEDSVSFLPALFGTDNAPLREAVVHHSINGSFAIRQGAWKLELCRDSGGWSVQRPGRDNSEKLPAVQLYDLAHDIAEATNVQDRHPEIVSRLTALLEKYVADGRSTPGSPQKNAVKVEIRK